MCDSSIATALLLGRPNRALSRLFVGCFCRRRQQVGNAIISWYCDYLFEYESISVRIMLLGCLDQTAGASTDELYLRPAVIPWRSVPGIAVFSITSRFRRV